MVQPARLVVVLETSERRAWCDTCLVTHLFLDVVRLTPHGVTHLLTRSDCR